MMCIYQDILFSVIIVDSKKNQVWFPVLFLRSLDLFIYFIHHGCKLLPISTDLIVQSLHPFIFQYM